MEDLPDTILSFTNLWLESFGKGRTIRKVMGGGGVGGEKNKKIHARENAKKKN